MSNRVIIESLEEILAKPGLSKARRKNLEARLAYWRKQSTNRRNITPAIEKSAKVRHMKARRKYRVIRPMIIRLQAEGLTGKEIVAALREAGITNLQGKPYSLGGIQHIMKSAP